MKPSRLEIADRIEALSHLAFEGSGIKEILSSSNWRSVTAKVKQTFGDLGKELGFFVAASGYPGADDGEWLYDMCWYSVSNERLFDRLPLVLESELKPGGSVLNAAKIDGDFEKLVQARAEVRVWFALMPTALLAEEHVANCSRQAKTFSGALQGDTYILIIYNWQNSYTSIHRFEV